ncbi:thioredoxin family protein [Peribacillus glennii]|uniref:Thioredoxin family protein n=1 Tax=Peribacillus glennii TaxID=2303991 RepID=A0A372LAZ4_9BACI|nr:thioredoxin family protein [Peribacillus glennii]RFU62916.1 thioredoxin family protein [Peribacillus glennii]
MSSLNDWFEKGLTKQEYIGNMKTHKDSLESIYERFKLTEQDKVELASIKGENLRAIILTADWCGDAMVNLPILMRIAEEANIDTRYLIRDENLELMDQYLTNGTARSIPILIFIDQNGEEAAKWGPRAPEVQSFVDDMRSTMPAKEDPAFDARFKLFIESVTNRFTTDEALWKHIKEDIINTIR